MKLILVAALSFGFALRACADTSNGNDFALSYSEAKAPAKDLLFQKAQGRPHFFRYLKITELQEISVDGRHGVRVQTLEPASQMGVEFTVTMPVSLALLSKDPVSKQGDAIAVSGKLTSINPVSNTVFLEEPIVRHKDRLSPKIGKEMLSEVDPSATVYSYTEGPRPVQVSARDRDLLQFRDKQLAEGGPKGWVEFLEKELSRRKQERAKEGKP